jgi:uncharacterized protein YeaO (DUF488 family)
VLKVKRVYEAPSAEDGFQILVDRLWPRGLTREKIDLRLKEIAPSNVLRKWFAHSEARWSEFKQEYFGELSDKREAIDIILRKMTEGDVTLLSGAQNEKLNNAVALREYLEKRR